MKYLIVFGLMFCSLFGRSQPLQNHFVYIQTENKRPFYVKINSDILSSTSSGYIIVPKLSDSTYQFIIGFPANEWPEQTVSLPVKKDAGFLLKNFEEKGWGLFNLQTFEIVMNGNKPNAEPEKVITSSDQFSKMLSEVVNDSSILKTTVSQKITPPQNKIKNDSPTVSTISPASVTDTSLSKVVNDSSILKTKAPQKITAPQNQIMNDSSEVVTIPPASLNDTALAIKETLIEKLASKTDSSGLEISFFDADERDTIKVALDFMIESNPKIDSSILVTTATKKQDSLANNNDANKGETTPQINQSFENPNNVKKDSSNQVEFLAVKKTSMVNSNCKQNAIPADVQKLERKMLSESSDDEKIRVAKKIFKAKCFTTEYIRQLSRLFITSAGKYNFFDMAYPYVSDAGLYNTLSSELLDNYYINRFNAMINK